MKSLREQYREVLFLRFAVAKAEMDAARMAYNVVCDADVNEMLATKRAVAEHFLHEGPWVTPRSFRDVDKLLSKKRRGK